MANEPGWYPDPWQPARRRWWDGNGWSDHTWDPERPSPIPRQPSAWLPPPDPRRDLENEHSAAVWARRAFVGLFVTRIVQGVISVVLFNDFIDDFRRAVDTQRADEPSGGALQALNLPVSIVMILSFIGIALWAYKAATVASKLNYPARHSPGWAVAGWFVPIINFWFPYQSVRDCLAPTNRERKTVRLWWALYLIGSFAWMAAVIVSIFAGVGIALALTLPCAVVSGLELQAALRVVDAVGADHTEAISRIVTTP